MGIYKGKITIGVLQGKHEGRPVVGTETLLDEFAGEDTKLGAYAMTAVHLIKMFAEVSGKSFDESADSLKILNDMEVRNDS